VTPRLLVLVAVMAMGALLVLLYGWYRKRWTPLPERLRVEDLGLELMSGCCAFVVFTTPSCRPCKAAVKVVSEIAREAAGPTEVVTVDATQSPELALRYEVRTIPTVFLITASGHVVHRWREVPTPADARGRLASV
jgi:thioredoxin 1